MTMEKLIVQSEAVSEELSIEEKIIRAEEAIVDPDSDAIREGAIVNVPSVTDPLPRMISEVLDAEHVWIWDTRTGERSKALKSMLRAQLLKPRPDGSFYFTTAQPDITPYRGTLKCLLHKDHADRGLLEPMGLPYCQKATLRTQIDVRQHMQRTHKREWAMLEEEKRLTIEGEERELRKVLIGRSASATAAPATAVTAPGVADTGSAVTDSPAPLKRNKRVHEQCPKCNVTISGKNEQGLKMARYHHKKKCPG